MSTTLPVKEPGETVTVAFDFSAETASVTSPSVTSTVYWSEGTPDAAPGNVLSGSPQLNGSTPAMVYQRITGGLDSTDYALRCVATAANGDQLVVPAILPVRRLP